MTLSRDLRLLADWFSEVREGRAEFTAEGMREYHAALDRAAWNAKALEEARPMPCDARMVQHGNVVAFSPTSRRRPRLSIVPDGGDVA